MTVPFPILAGQWANGVTTVPFMFVATAREQIERNHGQTLERLKERGGLSWGELSLGLNGESFSKIYKQGRMNEHQAAVEVLAKLTEFLRTVSLIELHGWRPR